MKCPKCNKDELKNRTKNFDQEIKGQTIDVVSDSFICQDCNFSFLDNDQTNMVSFLVSNKYRKQNGLLTAEEIRSYREKMNLTQDQFANFLSVELTRISSFEGIGIQNKALDLLIRSKCEEFLNKKET